jgi:DNA-binding protein H-NS
MTTYSNVKAQIAKLEKQAADLFKKEAAGVIEKARALIQEYGLTAADLGLAGKTTTPKKASAKPAGVAKYRDPVSGKTWTGHGKAPGFITEGVAAGKSRDAFLIGKKAPAAKPAKATTAVKPGKATNPAAKAKARKAVAARKPKASPVGGPATETQDTATPTPD